ncbi:MAG: hypothetical protein RR676_16105 [Acinetobacter sp.]
MLKKIILLGGCLYFSGGAWAQETNIIGFEQFFNLDKEHSYQLELGNLNPASQFWTAVYLVAVPKTTGNQESKLDFLIVGQGLLAKNHPTQPAEAVTLVAQDLPMRKNYSLKEFDDLTDEIEDQTHKEIQDPILTDASNVRVYGKIWDWIPEYNVNQPAKISFGVENAQDFDIKAAYLVVGEGEKTKQIMQLDIQPYSNRGDSIENPQVTRAERNLVWLETKFMIFFVVTASLIFLKWGKWRRRE